MDKRIDIKIVVLGDEGSGKKTFSRMFFLDNINKIRLEPLSKLADIIFEIDQDNFMISSKKIIDECNQHNNLIMEQTEIKSTQNLRDINIEPLFYKHTTKIKDLFNCNNNGTNLNKYILLTFYLIGNNYQEFHKEIDSANIIIYITDIEKKFNCDNGLFQYITDKIMNTGRKKYLLTLVNKCDLLNANGEFEASHLTNLKDPINQMYENFNDICQVIEKKTCDLKMKQYLLSPIPMSFKYSHIYRQIIHLNKSDISSEDRTAISDMFAIKSNNIIRDILRHQSKYLKRSGYYSFRDILANIINTKYKTMINDNFESNLIKLDKSVEIIDTDFTKFISEFKSMYKRASYLEEKIKYNYHHIIKMIIDKCFNKIAQNLDPQHINIVDQIRAKYNNDEIIINKCNDLHDCIRNKMITNICEKIYSDTNYVNTFLPSKVHTIYDNFIDLYPSKEETKKMVTYIFELYSNKALELLKNQYYELLYNSYFLEEETSKIMSLLSEIDSKVTHDVLKIFLVKILVVKLMIAEKCIEQKNILGIDKFNNIVTYCRSLKYLLLSYNKTQYHLFNVISDICANILFRIDVSLQLEHIYSNIDSVINYQTDKMVKFEKYVIKIIRKKDYQSTIARDKYDSEDDSDVSYDSNISYNSSIDNSSEIDENNMDEHNNLIEHNDENNDDENNDDETNDETNDDETNNKIYNETNISEGEYERALIEFTKDDLASDEENIESEKIFSLSNKKKYSKSKDVRQKKSNMRQKKHDEI